MRRYRLPMLLLVGLAVVGVLIDRAAVNGFGLRSRGCGCAPCCPPPCVIYVPVPVSGGGGGGGGGPAVDPKSKRVKFILALDLEDESIGRAVRLEGFQFEEFFRGLSGQYRGFFEFVQGKNLTAEGLLQAVKNMPVGKDETLVVYCNLHGRKLEGNKGGQELSMREGPPLSRDVLMKAIKDKGARLSVLITDSCLVGVAATNAAAGGAVPGPVAGPGPGQPEDELGGAGPVSMKGPKPAVAQDQKPPKPEPPPAPKPGDIVLPDPPKAETIKVLMDLFVNHRGVVNINSCSDDQYAFSLVFTPAFLRLCEDFPGEVTWPTFFQELQKSTAEKYKVQKEEALKDPRQSDKDKEAYKQEIQEPKAFELAVTYEAQEERGSGEEDGGGRRARPPVRMPAPPSGDARDPAAPAQITVRLPEGAGLTVDGAPTYQRAGTRLFQTPDLPPGHEFHYTLKAQVVRNGVPVEETKDVAVWAGARVEVDFGAMAAKPRAEAATLTVRLPAGAQFYVDGKLQEDKGETRTLTTPPLDLGKKFTYTLGVKRPGQDEVRTRQVEVEAGKHLEIDLADEAAADVSRKER